MGEKYPRNKFLVTALCGRPGRLLKNSKVSLGVSVGDHRRRWKLALHSVALLLTGTSQW